VRERIALLCVAAAVAGAPFAAPAANAAPVHAACGAGYVSARLPWGHRCLRAGEFCKVGNTAYRRYGFVCPRSGHLERRR
jgi:hypothetical protein